MASSSATDALEFFIGELAVGVLTGEITGKPGRWGYMPYRGPGHYDLVTKIHAGETVECSHASELGMVVFTVAAIPDYGMLEVTKVTNSN